MATTIHDAEAFEFCAQIIAEELRLKHGNCPQVRHEPCQWSVGHAKVACECGRSVTLTRDSWVSHRVKGDVFEGLCGCGRVHFFTIPGAA